MTTQGIHSQWAGCVAAVALLALPTLAANAASWYVRPNGGSYGNEDGTSWNNAFDGFSGVAWGSVSCGDTIWVAGGTYTQSLAPAKKCTTSSRLSIRRARGDATDATQSAGWSTTFASTVHQTGAGVRFSGDWDNITISGRTTAAGGGHGWWIDLRGRTSGAGINIENGAGADYNTMEYMDLQGPGIINYSGDGRGIDATPFSSATGNTFSHMKIFEWESAIYNAGINGSTFEYLDVFDIHAQNWSTWHPNGLYTSGAKDVIVRYSKFHKGPKGYGVGEGIFFEQGGGASNWQIYGNLFYNLNGSGLKAIQITSSVPGLRIFNNTFVDLSLPGVFVNGGSCGSGSETRNNLTYGSSGPSSCGTMSNNLTISSTPDPFVSRSSSDFRIVSNVGSGYPRNAGTNLSSTFRNDALGVSFGADGGWDIGAYEYAGASDKVPQAPTALIVGP